MIRFFRSAKTTARRWGLFWLPLQVRYVRWWYLRQAAFHELCAARGHWPSGRLENAARERETAHRLVERWRENGALPFTIVTPSEARARMQLSPQVSAAVHYQRWISPSECAVGGTR